MGHLLTPIRGNCRVISASLLSAGKLNTNYKVLLEGRDQALVLRVYTNDPIACERDAALYQLMMDKVPLAPMLYHARSGHGLDHPYAVFEWVSGVLLSEVLDQGNADDILGVAQSAGGVLAAINQFRFDLPGFLGVNLEYTKTSSSATASFRDYLAEVERSGRAATRTGRSEFDRMIRFIDDQIGCLAVVETWYSLVHADYTGNNLIVRSEGGGWAVGAVLDWEFAMAGTSIFDVGVFLRNEDTLPSGFRSYFIRAFADAGGHLPAGWRRASKLLDLINQFAFLDANGDYPNTFADATARIRTTITRWGEFRD